MAVITGTVGDDTITPNTVSAGVVGGKATVNADTISGGGGKDIIDGGGGDDIIEGGAGADDLDGGLGRNTLSYASSTSGVNVNLQVMSADTGDAQGDVIKNFVNIIGGSGSDSLADAILQDNAIDGGAGDDLIFSRGGNDVLKGGTNGSSGDTLSYAQNVLGAVTVSLALTSKQNIGIGQQTISGFENLTGTGLGDKLTGSTGDNVIFAGMGDDTVAGGGGADSLSGEEGNDTIAGGAGDDTLKGGDDNDLLEGGAGADKLVGGKGVVGDPLSDNGGWLDIISYASSATAVTIDFLTGTGKGGDAEGDAFTEIEGVIGSAFADVLKGDGIGRTFIGGAGADTISGGAADQDRASYTTSKAGVTVDLSLAGKQVSGGDASGDVLTGIEWADGSGLKDSLKGDGGVNWLRGFEGDDVLEGGAGADILDGGTGINTLSYASDAMGVMVNLNSGQVAGGDAQGDSGDISTFANIIGGKQTDYLTGNSAANVIDGGKGDDWIDPVSGNDTLKGGEGFDTVSFVSQGGTASVKVSLAVTTAQVTGLGTMTISGFEGVESGDSDDDLTGNDGKNIIDGGAGNDTIRGGKGDDELYGADGDDVFDGGAGADLIDGGSFGEKLGDWVTYAKSTKAVNIDLLAKTASGGDAAGDTLSNISNLIGTALADTLTGDATANILEGGLGNDILEGKGGSDTVSYASATAAVTFDLSKQGGAVQKTGGGGDDTIKGTSFVNVWGGAGNDTLTGDANDNTILGGAGDDLIEGGKGANTLDGGKGVNTLSYAHETDGLVIDLPTTYAHHGALDDVIANFQNVIGGSGDDGITGGIESNVLKGGAGDDSIFGGNGGTDILYGGANTALGDTLSFLAASKAVKFSLAIKTAQNTGFNTVTATEFENLEGSLNNDTLTGDVGLNIINGNAGNDLIEGGAGTDFLDGGADVDTVSYVHSKSGVKIDLFLQGVSPQSPLDASIVDDAAGDHLNGFENVIGTAKADWIQGDGSDNIIEGGLGNDTLKGAGGDDTVSFEGSTAAIFFDFANLGGTWNTGAGMDTISGFNRVIGGKAADTIVGEINDDWITGSLGADKLTGELGSDKFIYRALAEKGDHITDFKSGEDFLFIAAAGFKNTVAGQTNLAAASNPLASSTAAWFLYDTDDGKLYFDDDGTGAHAKVLLLTLDNFKTGGIAASDIIIS